MKDWHEQTLLIHGFTEKSQFEETSEPIYLTSGYTYKTAQDAELAFKGELERFVYSRYGNPTNRLLEKRIAALEGGEECFVTASGMAAVFAALAAPLKAGARVVSSRALFGSCDYIINHILPRFGIETVMVDGRNLDEWEKALSQKTDAVFMESPSNPNLEITDIERVAEMAHGVGARVIVDNIFANPLVQQPLKHKADIVVYSTTKHFDGQGRTIGGAIVGNQEFFKDYLVPFVRNTGPCMSPFVAWVVLKGMETIHLRNRVMCANALEVATFLEQHPNIQKVLYPGLDSHPQRELVCKQMSSGGNILALEIKGNREDAFSFMNRLQLIKISNNHGDAKTIITHPASTTHQRLSEEERLLVDIKEGSIRIACGLEDTSDLLRDIEQALL